MGGKGRGEGVKRMGINNLLEEIKGLLRDGAGPGLVVGIDFSSP